MGLGSERERGSEWWVFFWHAASLSLVYNSTLLYSEFFLITMQIVPVIIISYLKHTAHLSENVRIIKDRSLQPFVWISKRVFLSPSY